MKKFIFCVTICFLSFSTFAFDDFQSRCIKSYEKSGNPNKINLKKQCKCEHFNFSKLVTNKNSFYKTYFSESQKDPNDEYNSTGHFIFSVVSECADNPDYVAPKILGR